MDLKSKPLVFGPRMRSSQPKPNMNSQYNQTHCRKAYTTKKSSPVEIRETTVSERTMKRWTKQHAEFFLKNPITKQDIAEQQMNRDNFVAVDSNEIPIHGIPTGEDVCEQTGPPDPPPQCTKCEQRALKPRYFRALLRRMRHLLTKPRVYIAQEPRYNLEEIVRPAPSYKPYHQQRYIWLRTGAHGKFKYEKDIATYEGIGDFVSQTMSVPSNVNSLAETASTTLTSVRANVDTVTNTVVTGVEYVKEQTQSKLASMQEALVAGMDQLRTLLSNMIPTINGVTNIGATLLKVFKLIATVAMSQSRYRIPVFFLELSFGFTSEIVSALKGAYEAICAYFRKEEVENENAFDDVEYDEEDQPRLPQFFGQAYPDAAHYQGFMDNLTPDVMAPFIGVATASILALSFGLPTGNMDQCVSFFGKRCAALKNVSNYYRDITPMMNDIYDWIVRLFKGPMVDQEIEAVLQGYGEWAQIVLNLSQIGEDGVSMPDRIMRDRMVVHLVQDIHAKGVQLVATLTDRRLSPANHRQLMSLMKIVDGWKTLADQSPAFCNATRSPPMIIHYYGGTGVGKSALTWILAGDMLTACSNPHDVFDEVYFRNVEQEYWDNYKGQYITVYDDFAQKLDSQTNPNPEFFELIRIGNAASYPLHMASIQEKAKTRFGSQIVMLSSNTALHHLNVKSISHAVALQRRINISVEVTLDENFTKTIKGENNADVIMLDPTKVDLDPTAPYIFQRKDPTTGIDIGQPMDYDQFLTLTQKLEKENRRNGSYFKTLLARMRAPDRDAELRAQYQGATDDWTAAQEAKIQAVLTHQEVSSSSEQKVSLEIQKNLKEGVQWFKARLAEYATLKNMLMLLGGVLTSVGIWKMYTSTQTRNRHLTQEQRIMIDEVRDEYESNVSGDLVSKKAMTISREAHFSGDNLTAKAQAIKRESHSSGDVTTPRSKAVAREGFTSGDALTRNGVKVAREGFKSGDLITLKTPHVQLESDTDDASLHAWKDTSAQTLITNRLLTSTYRFMRVRNGEEKPLVNGVFIRDTVMLLPRHAVSQLVSTDSVKIVNILGTSHTIPVTDIRIVEILARDSAKKDAVLVQFPRKVNAHPDLVKHFVTSAELKYSRCDVALATLRTGDKTHYFCVLGNTQAKSVDRDLTIGTEIFKLREGLNYDLNTTYGDCGGIVVLQENSCIRKFAGIHVAGSLSGKGAYGQSVTQADLSRALVQLNGIIITDPDLFPNFQASPGNIEYNVLLTQEECRQLLSLPASNLGFGGVCAQPTFTPSKTDITPSKIHGLVAEPISKPAILFHPQVDILKKNLAKAALNTPYVPKDLLAEAVCEVKQKLFANTNQALRQVLSFEEAITGDTQKSEFLNPINRSSSPGYPYVLTKEAGTKGKQGWLGNGEYTFDEGVRKDVEERIRLASLGMRKPTTWTDTLKDERRPIEKVNALKTRVFSTGPMDYTIAFRMYFLGFMANVMENRITNEQSIGTNVYGPDWAATARKLQKFGQRVIAGDFSQFDGTLNSSIMWEFVNVINEWYDDGPENYLIRQVLFLDVINATHLCRDIFYLVDHSQPSGNPITTVLNSFYNSVSMRVVYYLCRENSKSRLSFDECVSMVSYGDDNVLNIAESVIGWFNQNTITEGYERIGMIYTDEAKSGGTVADYRQLSEVAYLKRRFIQRDGVWRAPLELSTVIETTNWIRNAPDADQACLDNCSDAIYELFQHGQETFDRLSRLINKACLDELNEMPAQNTYAGYRERIHDEFFSY
nr:MAG: nonstructural polyprotein [Aparavirus sp.]